MTSSIKILLPPIDEVWQEACVLYHYKWSTYPPTRKREANLERLIKHARTIVSLEEVFGPGLLKRMNDAQCIQCGEAKDDVLYRRQNTAYVNERENWIFACTPCFIEIQDYWKERWEDYYGTIRGY